MKNMKKLFSLALALVMMMALVVTAGAASTTPETGTITITNASKGATYTAYKLFSALDTDVAGGSITYQGTIPASLIAYFEENSSGNIVAKKDIDEQALFGDLKTWAEGQADLKEGDPGYAKRYTDIGDGDPLVFTVEDGYYVILSNVGSGSSVTVNSTNPNVVVMDKNTNTPHFPDPDPENPSNDGKKLTAINDNANVNGNTVKPGDKVTYTVTYNTVNYVTQDEKTEQVKSYEFTDSVPDFLSDMKVTGFMIGDKDYVDDLALGTEYPQFVNASGEKQSITINWANGSGTEDDPYTTIYPDGAVITITYTATVNENVTIGSNGNKNEITAKYTTVDNNTDTDKTDEDIYSYSFELVKYTNKGTAGSPNYEALGNAQFKLFDGEGTDANLINLVTVTGKPNTYRVAKSGETGVTDGIITTPVAAEGVVAGKITIEGLANGTYYLEEVEAPDGYNKLATRQAVKIDGQNITSTLTETSLSENGCFVLNQTGAELPATGGIGTTIFYVVGGVLMIGAAVLFLTKKRSEV